MKVVLQYHVDTIKVNIYWQCLKKRPSTFYLYILFKIAKLKGRTIDNRKMIVRLLGKACMQHPNRPIAYVDTANSFDILVLV